MAWIFQHFLPAEPGRPVPTAASCLLAPLCGPCPRSAPSSPAPRPGWGAPAEPVRASFGGRPGRGPRAGDEGRKPGRPPSGWGFQVKGRKTTGGSGRGEGGGHTLLHPVHFTGTGIRRRGREAVPDAVNGPAGRGGGRRGGGPSLRPRSRTPVGIVGHPGPRPCPRRPPRRYPEPIRQCHSHNREAAARRSRGTAVWSPRAPSPSMIVDKLLDDSRGGEGLLDAAGDCGLMTSPPNLAYFYGASLACRRPRRLRRGCSAAWPRRQARPALASSVLSASVRVLPAGRSSPGREAAPVLSGCKVPSGPQRATLDFGLRGPTLGEGWSGLPVDAKYLGQVLGDSAPALAAVHNHTGRHIRPRLDALPCAGRLVSLDAL